MSSSGTQHRMPWGGKRLVLLGLMIVFAMCVWRTGTDFIRVSDGANVWAGLLSFLRGAFQPAFFDQSPTLPDDIMPFFIRTLGDLLRTVRYALLAMTIAVPLGMVLGLLTSTAWWPASASLGNQHRAKRALRGMLHGMRWLARSTIALMRSVHELIWAMLFLSALGDAPMTACVALALPFAGTLGKVFSELIEEQARHAHTALTGAGASSMQGFFIALFPEVLPNLLTYTAYRFECALRSSAVLGFIGIETIGLTIRRSFDNLYYGEVWTSLYLLLFVIILVDRLSAWLRHRLQRVPAGAEGSNKDERALRQAAPRDLRLRVVLHTVTACILAAWLLGPSVTEGLGKGDRSARLARFVTKMTPDPAKPADPLSGFDERVTRLTENRTEVASWAVDLWREPGQEALINTLAIATAAIILAALLAIICLPLGSRVLATTEPFGLLGTASRWKRQTWRFIGLAVRVGFVLSRAIPEYILAFLLVGMLGPSAWPLIIALAVHNVGVLGRLWGEVVENQGSNAPRQVLLAGGGRLQAFLGAVFPAAFNRFLLFFFYRWETCLREATILGMLGISSLGYYISISRNYLQYDRMLFFVLLGAIVIFIGDLFSDWLRYRLRDSA